MTPAAPDGDTPQVPEDNVSTGTRSARPKRAGRKSRGTDLTPFPYQLRDSYLHSCKLERRAALDGDPERPHFQTSFAMEIVDDQPGFVAYLTVSALFIFRPGATCEVTVCTTGVFRQSEGLSPEDEGQFMRDDCAVLLWPYARANLGEVVRMAGIPLPPLPTVDVRRSLANRASADLRAKG
jgi:preprotein translocase subunit SecB